MNQNQNGQLSERDNRNMDGFIGHVLDDFRDGIISKQQAVSGLAHVMAALEQGNYDEAKSWFEQGRKFIRQ